jgi:hypothetical protein
VGYHGDKVAVLAMEVAFHFVENRGVNRDDYSFLATTGGLHKKDCAL